MLEVIVDKIVHQDLWRQLLQQLGNLVRRNATILDKRVKIVRSRVLSRDTSALAGKRKKSSIGRKVRIYGRLAVVDDMINLNPMSTIK